jgi:Ca-activated chloride channel family protein
MILSQPQYLWLLLLVPLFFAVQVFVDRLRRARLRRFGDEALVEALMPSYTSAKTWLRLSLFAVAFCFFVLALSRPQRGVRLKEQQVSGAEVIIALDVSNSMLAEDYSPNRLERAKLAISQVTEKLRDDRIGLIVFAGESYVQIPLTSDYISARMFLNSISTRSVPVQGTAIGAAIDMAMRSFSENSDKSRAIIIITDGENHEDDPVSAAQMAAQMGIRVFTIGVGSKEGTFIPLSDGGYITDADGNNVVTRLDDETLQQIAAEGDGLYVQSTNKEFGLAPVIEEIQNMEDKVTTTVTYEEYEELYMYFLGVALLFLVLEMLVGDRRSKVHLFRR